MTRPWDGQPEVLEAIEDLLEMPDLGAEELGRVAITLEQFISSELVTQSEAAEMLADRKVDASAIGITAVTRRGGRL
jgi:hypothetical protein